jgi:hypothetical protein
MGIPGERKRILTGASGAQATCRFTGVPIR